MITVGNGTGVGVISGVGAGVGTATYTAVMFANIPLKQKSLTVRMVIAQITAEAAKVAEIMGKKKTH